MQNENLAIKYPFILTLLHLSIYLQLFQFTLSIKARSLQDNTEGEYGILIIIINYQQN